MFGIIKSTIETRGFSTIKEKRMFNFDLLLLLVSLIWCFCKFSDHFIWSESAVHRLLDLILEHREIFRVNKDVDIVWEVSYITYSNIIFS